VAVVSGGVGTVPLPPTVKMEPERQGSGRREEQIL